jgi:hypothetical protein
MQRARGALSRVERERSARKNVFASMHRATTRAHSRNSKCFDEIRISCAREVCARRANAHEIFRFAHFFSRAFACRPHVCAEQNNFAQFVSHDGVERRNRSKTSESAPSDSRRIPSRDVKFLIARTINCDSHRKFSSTMCDRRRRAHKNTARVRVRRRVSSSGDR